MVHYETLLFKTKSNLEEPVLRMMYNYRKDKFVAAMLVLLDGVMWVCANGDPKNVLLRHLLTMDPPAYSCQRYWDWIEPYIQEKI